MKHISKGKMWVFALGQMGWAILGGIISSWLVYFYQPEQEIINLGHQTYVTQGSILGVFTIVGLVAMFGRIFDAFTDPIIATASDKSTHRLGRRIPFLRYAALPFGLVTVLLFTLPSGTSVIMNNVLFVVLLLLFYLFMTLYCTPYNALIPELGKNQEEKINISTYISITFIVGTGLAYTAPYLWEAFIGGGMERMAAIRVTFGILSAIAVILMLIPAFFLNEKEYADSKPSNTDTFKSLTKTFQNKNFRVFVASDVLYFVALALFQTGLSFFVVGLLELEETMTTNYFILMMFVSFLFYMPVNIAAKKLGKKKLVVIGFIVFALVFLFSTFMGLYGFSPVAQGYVMSLSAAIPMAILGILPQAIVADIAQADAKETGENRSGMFFAARTFSFKLGQAIAILIFASLQTLGDSGYRISLGLAVVFTLLGAIILMKYNETGTLETLGE